MMNFQELIDAEKEKYIASVQSFRRQMDIICIYGAGTIGRTLYNVLTEAEIKVDSFCVTNKQINNEKAFPIPMYEINEFNRFAKDKVGFLIAVEPPTNKEIKSTLNQNGFEQFFDAPKYAKFFLKDGTHTRKILEITTRIGCSVNCKYCPQSTLLRNYKSHTKELSLENYVCCIDKLSEDVIVRFAGFVESFLSCSAENMIQYAYDKGHEIELFTTLVGMTDEKLEKIRKIHFREVVLHLPDKDGLAAIPLTEEYFSLLKTVLEMHYEDGTPFISRANCQGEIHPLIKPFINKRLLIFGEMNNRAGNLNERNLKSSEFKKGRVFCNGSDSWNHNVLLPDGSVVLCSMDFGLRHILGNLLTQSYEDIINGDVIRKMRDSLTEGNVDNCLCRTCSEAMIIKE